VEYGVGLSETRDRAEWSAQSLQSGGIDYTECTVTDCEHTVHGWLERPFDMEEPQAHMEPHGLQRELSEWLDHQRDLGRSMVVLLVSGDPADAASVLRRGAVRPTSAESRGGRRRASVRRDSGAACRRE